MVKFRPGAVSSADGCQETNDMAKEQIAKRARQYGCRGTNPLVWLDRGWAGSWSERNLG